MPFTLFAGFTNRSFPWFFPVDITWLTIGWCLVTLAWIIVAFINGRGVAVVAENGIGVALVEIGGYTIGFVVAAGRLFSLVGELVEIVEEVAVDFGVSVKWFVIVTGVTLVVATKGCVISSTEWIIQFMFWFEYNLNIVQVFNTTVSKCYVGGSVVDHNTISNFHFSII